MIKVGPNRSPADAALTTWIIFVGFALAAMSFFGPVSPPVWMTWAFQIVCWGHIISIMWRDSRKAES